jgi:ParB-like chromosome segregation protein Spo0J
MTLCNIVLGNRSAASETAEQLSGVGMSAEATGSEATTEFDDRHGRTGRTNLPEALAAVGAASTAPVAPSRLSLFDLVLPDSPRLAGLDEEHARVLAESGCSLPPILVNRRTMRVVDGAHRVLAAGLRGETEINAWFCDCDDESAFVLAVRSNVAHGLPLSKADRTAAAERILASRQQWSDRAIASVVGLSHKTVGVIRRRSTGNPTQLDTSRRGRDGRLRPVNGSAGRAEVARLLADRQGASLREIARTAGVSPDTVRHVRDRLRPPEAAPEPVGPAGDGRRAELPRRAGTARFGAAAVGETSSLIHSLRSDPSLRFSDGGRALLRLLDISVLDQGEWARLTENVPAHRADSIARLARECSRSWQKFATSVEQRQGGGATA